MYDTVKDISDWQCEIDAQYVDMGKVLFNSTEEEYAIPIHIPKLSEGRHFIDIRAVKKKDTFHARGQIMVLNHSPSLLIGVITDPHFIHPLTEYHRKHDENMRIVIDQLNIHNPDVIFFLGDYDEDHQPPIHLLTTIEKLNAPVIVGRGNHEHDNNNELAYDAYLSDTQTYFSKTLGPYHLVIINGNELSPDGEHIHTVMSQKQLDWLEKELANNRDKYLIVATEPAIVHRGWNNQKITSSFNVSNLYQQDKLKGMFEAYGVKIVIQGDKHQSSDIIVNGVRYLTISSPTIPFMGYPWAGYGLIWIKSGALRFAGTIDVFHKNTSDPYAFLSWDPSRHHLKYYYSLRTFSLSKSEDRLQFDVGNLSTDYELLPFRVVLGAIYDAGTHFTDSNGKTIAAFNIPSDMGPADFKRIGTVDGKSGIEYSVQEYSTAYVKLKYSAKEQGNRKFTIHGLKADQEYQIFVDNTSMGTVKSTPDGQVPFSVDREGTHLIEIR